MNFKNFNIALYDIYLLHMTAKVLFKVRLFQIMYGKQRKFWSIFVLLSYPYEVLQLHAIICVFLLNMFFLCESRPKYVSYVKSLHNRFIFCYSLNALMYGQIAKYSFILDTL